MTDEDPIRKKVRHRVYLKFYRRALKEFGSGKYFRQVVINGKNFGEYLEAELAKAKYKEAHEFQEPKFELPKMLSPEEQEEREKQQETEKTLRRTGFTLDIWHENPTLEEIREQQRENLEKEVNKGLQESFDASFCPRCKCKPCMCAKFFGCDD